MELHCRRVGYSYYILININKSDSRIWMDRPDFTSDSAVSEAGHNRDEEDEMVEVKVRVLKQFWNSFIFKFRGASCHGVGSGQVKQQRISLNLYNVSGLFLILFAGLAFSLFIVTVEFYVRQKELRQQKQQVRIIFQKFLSFYGLGRCAASSDGSQVKRCKEKQEEKEREAH